MTDPLTCARCGIPIEHWYEVRWEWNRDATEAKNPRHVGYCPGEGLFSDAGFVEAEVAAEPQPQGLE